MYLRLYTAILLLLTVLMRSYKGGPDCWVSKIEQILAFIQASCATIRIFTIALLAKILQFSYLVLYSFFDGICISIKAVEEWSSFVLEHEERWYIS